MQESHARSQEAYRPPCRKNSLFCPGEGVPYPSGGYSVMVKEERPGTGLTTGAVTGLGSTPEKDLGLEASEYPSVNRQTPVKTLLSLILLMRVVTKQMIYFRKTQISEKVMMK